MAWALRSRKEEDKHLLNPLKCQTPGLTSDTPQSGKQHHTHRKPSDFSHFSYIQATPLVINVLEHKEKFKRLNRDQLKWQIDSCGVLFVFYFL